MSKQTVTLQGKTFDAVTGAVIRDVSSAKDEPAAKTASSRKANHAKRHTTQPAHTLMRHAVKKPSVSFRSQAKAQSALTHPQPKQIVTKRSVTQVDDQRLKRAEAISKHAKIGRFHVPAAISFVLADIPVKQMPESPTNTPPKAPPPTPTNKPTDMFEKAMESATHFVDLASHRTAYKKQARKHIFTMAAGTLAVLAIVGIALFQNSPSLQLRVAGYRAGVATVTPDFKESGFTYNGASVQGARVVIGLTADGVSYQLSQEETNWSGEEMIAQVSSIDAAGQANYTTFQVDSLSVYRLGPTQASWVANGTWYQLSGNRSLSDTQITTLIRNM